MKIKLYIMVNGQRMIIGDMVEVYKYGQMEVNMKVIGRMIKQILKEN